MGIPSYQTALGSELFFVTPLIHLDLRGNRLAGGLPASLPPHARLPLPRGQPPLRLAFLDLGRNWFSGQVPPDLLALRALRYLQLRHNVFSGDEVPRERREGAPPPDDAVRRAQGMRH
ncbi:hypothetical protein PR202_ga04523 [Eleusine coracana subsp. coracana]|uniref:Uncharacterized protein n=1 Tax=Eleusine coracana subsp. coracana TaxID=191504 RepID=A0AAV5BRZ4_ELECO|nr:hypothetical protein PR202_ga04523 [Eleusine coracana subsp. coracana]